MVLASDVKEGNALRLDGKIWKVLEVVRHAGSGQMHGFIELKLHDIRFGHFSDRRFKHADHLDNLELRKRQMNYLYSDNEAGYFMDPESFEQVSIPKAAIGTAEKFMTEGMKITVELLGEEAVTVQFTEGGGIQDRHHGTRHSRRPRCEHDEACNS